MAIRKIVLKNDPHIRKISKEIKSFDDNLHVLLDDMKETMTKNDGIGIAAVQVGVLKRAIIININNLYLEMLNPVIKDKKGRQLSNEGCLSVPDITGCVERPETIMVEAFDRYGNFYSMTVTGIVAVVIAHEIDHLQGVLFTDKLVDDPRTEGL